MEFGLSWFVKTWDFFIRRNRPHLFHFRLSFTPLSLALPCPRCNLYFSSAFHKTFLTGKKVRLHWCHCHPWTRRIPGKIILCRAIWYLYVGKNSLLPRYGGLIFRSARISWNTFVRLPFPPSVCPSVGKNNMNQLYSSINHRTTVNLSDIVWCMSGGVWSMSGGVWWCLMHVWWCLVVSMKD